MNHIRDVQTYDPICKSATDQMLKNASQFGKIKKCRVKFQSRNLLQW